MTKSLYPQFSAAVGGVGGSGTRVIAEILAECGHYIGGFINPSSDNLWFTFLLRRPEWSVQFPPNEEIVHALKFYFKCMNRTTDYQVTDDDRAYISKVLEAWRPHKEFQCIWGPASRQLLNGDNIRSNGQLWAWKEPNTHVFLPWLLQVNPDTKYIHVIRNGFDMAFSRNQSQLRAWGRHFGVNADLVYKVTVHYKASYSATDHLGKLRSSTSKRISNENLYSPHCRTVAKPDR